MGWLYQRQYYWIPRQQTVRHSDGRQVVTTRFGPRDWTRKIIHPDGRKSVVRSNSYGPMTTVMGIGMLLVVRAAFLGVFSIPIYLGATFLFILRLKSRTKSQQSTSQRSARQGTSPRSPSLTSPPSARPTGGPASRPPSALLTEGNCPLEYQEAYDRMAQELRQQLEAVTNQESARSFVEEAVMKLKAAVASAPEFYVGEFYHKFQMPLRDDARAEIASSKRETEQITSRGIRQTADLNARLHIARQAGDHDAEHSLWIEAEQRKAENQAAVDALTNRLTLGALRLRAIDDLGSTFGYQRDSIHERSQVATAANDNRPSSKGSASNMGPVETAVRNSINTGAVLSTLTGRGQFIVADIGARGPILLLGPKQARTLIPWTALEGVPRFLGAEGWTVIGMVFNQEADPTTLHGHMMRFVNRASANYVARLLEEAKVVQIDRRPSAKVRVRPDFSSPPATV